MESAHSTCQTLLKVSYGENTTLEFGRHYPSYFRQALARCTSNGFTSGSTDACPYPSTYVFRSFCSFSNAQDEAVLYREAHLKWLGLSRHEKEFFEIKARELPIANRRMQLKERPSDFSTFAKWLWKATTWSRSSLSVRRYTLKARHPSLSTEARPRWFTRRDEEVNKHVETKENHYVVKEGDTLSGAMMSPRGAMHLCAVCH